MAAHGYFGRLIFQYASFNNSRSLPFFLAAWPVVGIWFATLAVISFPFHVNGLNFNHSVLDHRGRVINTHNFPLDLAATASTPVALMAPAIG